MSVKNYFVRFGTGNPATYTGLAPTFIVFSAPGGATTAPGFSEIASTGIYHFQYECTGSIAFVADGATTSLASADRYVAGALDIGDRNDQFIGTFGDAAGSSTLFGQGVYGQSSVAVGNTLSALMGTTAAAIGDSSTDPTSVFGFLKRAQEIGEGDSSYTKSTGALALLDRTGATTLASKTISDSSGVVSKS